MSGKYLLEGLFFQANENTPESRVAELLSDRKELDDLIIEHRSENPIVREVVMVEIATAHKQTRVIEPVMEIDPAYENDSWWDTGVIDKLKSLRTGEQDPEDIFGPTTILDILGVYACKREIAYGKMLDQAVEHKEFSPIVGFIAELGDPVPARNLLATAEQDFPKRADIFLGFDEQGQREYYQAMDRVDDEVRAFRYALKTHGRRERDERLQDNSLNGSPNFVGDMAIRLQMKTSIGVKRMIRETFSDPLKEVAAKPEIEYQLIDRLNENS